MLHIFFSMVGESSLDNMKWKQDYFVSSRVKHPSVFLSVICPQNLTLRATFNLYKIQCSGLACMFLESNTFRYHPHWPPSDFDPVTLNDLAERILIHKHILLFDFQTNKPFIYFMSDSELLRQACKDVACYLDSVIVFFCVFIPYCPTIVCMLLYFCCKFCLFLYTNSLVLIFFLILKSKRNASS